MDGGPWQGVAEAGNWLLSLRDRLGPDLIHLNSYALAALPWDVPAVVTAHCCVLSWWSALRGSPAPPTWNRYRREVRRGLASADLVVAPTRTMLQCLQRHYGPLRAARWIALGRDPALFLPRAKQGYVLAGSLGDDPESPSALDEAAWALRWPVFLLGDADRPDGGPRFARPLGRLPLPMRAAWLGRASVYVLPSRNAPGLSVLEAALAGCALVLGDIPSLREGWDGAAVFVDPDDAAALTREIRSLMDDATRGSFLAQRARARALDLSPARMAREYLEAYALAGQTASARAGVPA